jgi:uncharacterized membrane protein
MKSITKGFKTNFLTGLVILIPVALTFVIIRFLVDFLTKPFVGFIKKIITHFASNEKINIFLSNQTLVENCSKLIVLILIFSFIVFLGLLTRVFFLERLINLWDEAINKIPLIKAIYKTTKDLFKSLFINDKNAFRQVAIVKFPGHDQYVLGLVVKDAPKECSKAIGHNLISVFIPTAPNPTSGYIIMVKKQDLQIVDVKPEEALKFIVSCGVIVPCKKPS